MKKITALFASAIFLFGFSLPTGCASCSLIGSGSGPGATGNVVRDTLFLPLGESSVRIVRHKGGDTGLLHINLHDDENTSVIAASAVVASEGGTLIELAHSGARNVSFQLNGKPYAVDPNRIFTEVGIRATLSRYSETVTESAVAAVTAFSDSLLSLIELEKRTLLIAVHNNTDNQYSAASYSPGNEYASDATSVFIRDGSDPDDFYFVTEQEWYDRLTTRGYNSVLQNNALATDDGSLSVLCGRLGIPYINVEAQHGHVEIQSEMIRAIASDS